jgi:beta-lactamase regulating signal transducer with metallopeptidase domain
LFLEKEKSHQFNRFYLLTSIVISFVIPFLSFEIIEIIPVVKNIESIKLETFSSAFNKNPILENVILLQETINYIPHLLWSLYGLMTLLLIIRFAKNCFNLISKSKLNQNVKYQNANLILIAEKMLPHTFLNSIFINSEDYNNRNIEEELFTHELVHVTQKHTFDILFIELLMAIFWFNPVFILYKKAIQLNHEFLADEKVVNSYNNVTFYQNLLLQKSSNIQTIYLASNLNYLVTKKRLIMMTKAKNNSTIFLKKILIIPILFLMVGLSCDNDSSAKKDIAKMVVEEVVEAGAKEKRIEPQFLGAKSFKEFLLLKYKLTAFDNKNQNLEVRFVVKKDGSITNLKVLNAENKAKENDLLRILKDTPKWVSGTVDGKNAQFQQNINLF